MNPSSTQLQLLQSLLQAGHRSIRLRPSSLARWGLAFAFLAWSTDALLRVLTRPGEVEWQALLACLWLGGGLGLTAFWDWRSNLLAAQRAKETLPFTQGQVVKVWWLLLSAGILYTISTFFWGGSYQIYMVWLCLIGLGLFLQGLFSQELVEWVGASCFLLALLVLLSGLPVTWHRPLAINVCGLGLPLLGWMLHRWPQGLAVRPLMSCVVVWMVASVVPALLWVQWQPGWSVPANVPVYTQAELQRLGPPSAWPHQLALRVPAGSVMALRLELEGDVLRAAPAASGAPAHLNYAVTQDLEFLLSEGQLTRQIRHPGEPWRERTSWLRIDRLDFVPDLTQPAGIVVQSRAQLRLGGPN